MSFCRLVLTYVLVEMRFKAKAIYIYLHPVLSAPKLGNPAQTPRHEAGQADEKKGVTAMGRFCSPQRIAGSKSKLLASLFGQLG